MIQRFHLEQLDQYDYVVANYANQQLFLRAATRLHYIIKPRFVTAHEMLELVTFKSPTHLDVLVVKHLQLNPGFTSTVEEILRSPNLTDVMLPHSFDDFYHQLIHLNVITPRVYLAPDKKIGILGPLDPLLNHYLASFEVESIKLIGLDSSIEYTSFDTQYDEVVGVMEEVARVLSEQGFGQVALFVNDETYSSYLSMMAKRHHIPLEFQLSKSVLMHPVIATLFHEFKSNPTLDHFISLLPRLLEDESETLETIHRKLTRWASEYQTLTLVEKDILALVKHALESVTYRSASNQHVVKVYSNFKQPIEEPYLIVMGVNQGMLPRVTASSQLISDRARGELKLPQNKDKNRMAIDEFILQVSLHDRVWLTAKARSASQIYAPTVLLKHPTFGPLIKQRDAVFSRPLRFSSTQDLIAYKKMRFQQQRLGFYTAELEFLHYHYESKLPPAYSNQFSGIHSTTLSEYPAPNSTSYSSLNSFFNCQFRYWMNHVLVVDEFEETLALHIGNMTHYVLKLLGYHFGGREFKEKIIAFAEEYIGEIKHQIKPSDLFYLRHVIPHMTRAVELLQQFKEHSRFELQFIEQKVTVPLKKSLITLQGVIDHVSIHEDDFGPDKVLLVDYKSGSKSNHYKKIQYGIDAQLFIYMLLVRESELLDNPVFTGAFNFGMVPSAMPVRNEKKTLQEQLDENYRFEGYVTDDLHQIELMYDQYKEDPLFKLNVNKDGSFGAHARNYSQEELSMLLDYLLARIELAGFDIQAGVFPINPKIFGYSGDYNKYTDSSCKYCNLKDICYHTEADYVEYSIDSNERFGDLLERINNAVENNK